MTVQIEQENLKEGVLALAIALVEIVRDVLRLQALERMEAGALSQDEVDRLGRALMELDMAIEQIKAEQGIGRYVQSVREGLDDIAREMVGSLACGQNGN